MFHYYTGDAVTHSAAGMIDDADPKLRPRVLRLDVNDLLDEKLQFDLARMSELEDADDVDGAGDAEQRRTRMFDVRSMFRVRSGPSASSSSFSFSSSRNETRSDTSGTETEAGTSNGGEGGRSFPNVTDKETVINFAKMAANAYTELPHTGDWKEVSQQLFLDEFDGGEVSTPWRFASQ